MLNYTNIFLLLKCGGNLTARSDNNLRKVFNKRTGDYHGNKNKEISNEEYRHLLNTLYGCLKEADNGKEYKEMVGEEIIKRHNRRQSPLLKQ